MIREWNCFCCTGRRIKGQNGMENVLQEQKEQMKLFFVLAFCSSWTRNERYQSPEASFLFLLSLLHQWRRPRLWLPAFFSPRCNQAYEGPSPYSLCLGFSYFITYLPACPTVLFSLGNSHLWCVSYAVPSAGHQVLLSLQPVGSWSGLKSFEASLFKWLIASTPLGSASIKGQVVI